MTDPTRLIPVEPHVILYAFRYGLGRMTYAHSDALSLVRRHWAVLAQWRASIVYDLEMQVALDMTAGSHVFRHSASEVAEMERLIDWIGAQDD